MRGSRRWVALWALGLAGLTVTATMVCGATDSMGYDHSKKGLLIKFDDLNAGNIGSHYQAAQWCRDRNLRCADGMWAIDLLDGNYTWDLSQYLAKFMDQTNRNQFELWLHGWHVDCPNQTYQSGYKTQQAMFFDSQKALIERLGVVFRTWGPHYLGPDNDTGWIFSQDPLISVWFNYADGAGSDVVTSSPYWKYVFEPHYYWENTDPAMPAGTFPCLHFDGWDKSNQVDVLTNWPYVPLGCRSLGAFSNALCRAIGVLGWAGQPKTNDAAEFVVQGHPHEWDDTSRTHYEQILDWLAYSEITNHVETRLPSYWARLKSNPSATVQPPNNMVTNLVVSRIEGTDRAVRLRWDPVWDSKESPSDVDVPCPAYIIRRDNAVVGIARPLLMPSPAPPITTCSFTEHSESRIPSGAAYTVQPVSTMWVMGTSSEQVTVPAEPTAPLVYVDSLSPGLGHLALEGETTEGVLDLASRCDDPTNVTVQLSDGISDKGWTWEASGTYTTNLTLGARQRVALKYRFNGSLENAQYNKVIVSGISTNTIAVRIYHRELHLAPADFDNYSALVSAGKITGNGTAIWSTATTNISPIWSNAVVLTREFSAENFASVGEVIVGAATCCPDAEHNTFLVSFNNANPSRDMLWNCITNGGTNTIDRTNLVTSCGNGVTGNYGSSFQLPQVLAVPRPPMEFGRGDTNSVDRGQVDGAYHYSLQLTNNTLRFGFAEGGTSMTWVEVWSLTNWVPVLPPQHGTVITITMQTSFTGIGGWGDLQSLCVTNPVEDVFYKIVTGWDGSYWAQPMRTYPGTGLDWGAWIAVQYYVPEWQTIRSLGPMYYRFAISRTNY
jgi:hypothetical protein